MTDDEQKEQTLIKMLQAYVQEWGEKNITIFAPRAWKGLDPKPFCGALFDFSTVDTIKIQASLDGLKTAAFEIPAPYYKSRANKSSASDEES